MEETTVMEKTVQMSGAVIAMAILHSYSDKRDIPVSTVWGDKTASELLEKVEENVIENISVKLYRQGFLMRNYADRTGKDYYKLTTTGEEMMKQLNFNEERRQ